MEFLKNLHIYQNGEETKNSFTIIKNYLTKRNRGPTENIISRTICLLDATASMSHLLQNAKNTVTTMFEQISQILIDHKYNNNCYAMRFAFYCNYNCQEHEIFMSSTWEGSPINLRQFMDTVSASYG